MAVDFHLLVKDIAGESKQDGHAGEIDVLSWSWGESQSSGASAGTGGTGAGKVAMQDLSVSMVMSKASVPLALACAEGTHIPTVTLKASKAGGKQNVFYTITLTDAFISSYSSGGSSGGSDLPMESVSFTYKKIKWEYQPQAATGATGNAIPATFNLETFVKE